MIKRREIKNKKLLYVSILLGVYSLATLVLNWLPLNLGGGNGMSQDSQKVERTVEDNRLTVKLQNDKIYLNGKEVNRKELRKALQEYKGDYIRYIVVQENTTSGLYEAVEIIIEETGVKSRKQTYYLNDDYAKEEKSNGRELINHLLKS